MVEVEIITGKNCEKCTFLKGHLPEDNRITYYDQKSVDALTLLAYHQLLEQKLPLPIIFVDDVPQMHLYPTGKTRVMIVSRAIECILEALEEPEIEVLHEGEIKNG